MEAVTSQSGSTRVSPLVLAVVASAAIAGLIALGSMTGVLPYKRPPMPGDEPRVDSKPAQARTCAVCGTIESIRTVEVLEELGPTDGAAEARSDKDAGPASPNTSMSVLDTLSSVVTGNDSERNVRKRRAYRVTLRMDDGSFRAVSLSNPPIFAVGEKVRVVEGRLVRG